MDINTLKAFVAVSDCGSFSKAAEQIYISQPAVSKRIALLEHEMGLRLFDRVGRDIRLTEAGQALLPRAQSIINQLDDAKRAIHNISGQMSPTLRMATSHHIGLHRLPTALQTFHQQYPAVTLDLLFMDSEKAADAVAQGRIELAVITLPTSAEAPLLLDTVWPDPLQIVVGLDHPLAKENKYSLSTLLDYPAVLPGPGTVTRQLILDKFGQHADDLTIGMSTNYLEVLYMLTAIGLGWSALPETLIDDGLKVIEIEGINIERRLGIVSHQGLTISNTGRAMIDIIKASI